MPTAENFALIVLVLEALLLPLMLFFIQRRVQKSDKEDTDWKDSMEMRMSKAEDHGHGVDLALQSRVTREDLERLTSGVYNEITELRKAMDIKFDGMGRIIMDALQRPR